MHVLKRIILYKHAFFNFLLVLGTYFFTSSKYTASLALIVFIAGVFFFIGFVAFKRKPAGESVKDFYKLVYLVEFLLLTLVGTTGWFYSPFFFLLYFAAFGISFLVAKSSGAAFLACLLLIFVQNIGDVDFVLDLITALSLALSIPASYYFAKYFMHLRESEKKILILEKEKQGYRNVVEQVLANKVNDFAVGLKQPVNDVKQMASRILDGKADKLEVEYLKRIVASSEEALQMIKGFYQETTGKKLLSSI